MSKYDKLEDDIRRQEDWSDSLDDMDGGDWADYFSLDSDSLEDQDENEGIQSYRQPPTIENDAGEIKESHSGLIRNRKLAIVTWLVESSYSRIDRNPLGFSIRRGIYCKLRNGNRVDLQEWLISEKIGKIQGEVIQGYSVRFSDGVLIFKRISK